MVIRRIFCGILVFYLGCLVVGFLNIYGYFGAIGRAPLALLGHKTSIVYMYDCSSYEIRNRDMGSFWLKKGAAAKIPEFQRLYGGQLLNVNFVEGINQLSEAAESGDYYAAAILSDLYEDQNLKIYNPSLSLKYKNMSERSGSKEK